jgi:hypothetical protein
LLAAALALSAPAGGESGPRTARGTTVSAGAGAARDDGHTASNRRGGTRAAPSALVVLAPAGETRLASLPGMSVGIMSASQGQYSPAQLMLDITQGARVPASAYPHPAPSPLSARPGGTGAAGTSRPSESEVPVAGWSAARRRAESAPQLLRPGLLAAQIPGGAGYVAISPGADHATADDGYAGAPGGAYPDAPLAADRTGRIAVFSTGSPATLLARVAALRARKRLVIADLPDGAAGRADLRALARGRAAAELLIVVQRVTGVHAGQLLWVGAAGLGGGSGRDEGGMELTSQSTGERGLVVSVDLAPTILRHLGLTVPADMRGDPIRADGPLNGAGLRALMARLYTINARRLPALGWLLGTLALVLVAAAPWPRARAQALRACGLAVLWAPVAVLLPAGLEPSAAVEYATIALACLALGALTDLLAPWPRAPLLPAIAAVVALAIDALAGTQLLVRSLLGPDPLLGARFYGIGNELKSGLAVLVLAAVAAWLYPCARGRRAALCMAGAGVALAIVEGSARIGAGVGGVLLVSAGTAVAVVTLLPGVLTRRRALSVLIAPVAGLLLLAALDLATAHGAGHFTGSVLHARSPGDVRDIIVRRYTAAWEELGSGAMPVATALALLAAALGVLRRERLLEPVGEDPAWLAALAGGLTAGVVGALVEDSGPLLLVVAVLVLACVLGYLWGGRPAAECPALDSASDEQEWDSSQRPLLATSRPPARPRTAANSHG